MNRFSRLLALLFPDINSGKMKIKLLGFMSGSEPIPIEVKYDFQGEELPLTSLLYQLYDHNPDVIKGRSNWGFVIFGIGALLTGIGLILKWDFFAFRILFMSIFVICVGSIGVLAIWRYERLKNVEYALNLTGVSLDIASVKSVYTKAYAEKIKGSLTKYHEYEWDSGMKLIHAVPMGTWNTSDEYMRELWGVVVPNRPVHVFLVSATSEVIEQTWRDICKYEILPIPTKTDNEAVLSHRELKQKLQEVENVVNEKEEVRLRTLKEGLPPPISIGEIVKYMLAVYQEWRRGYINELRVQQLSSAMYSIQQENIRLREAVEEYKKQVADALATRQSIATSIFRMRNISFKYLLSSIRSLLNREEQKEFLAQIKSGSLSDLDDIIAHVFEKGKFITDEMRKARERVIVDATLVSEWFRELEDRRDAGDVEARRILEAMEKRIIAASRRLPVKEE